MDKTGIVVRLCCIAVDKVDKSTNRLRYFQRKDSTYICAIVSNNHRINIFDVDLSDESISNRLVTCDPICGAREYRKRIILDDGLNGLDGLDDGLWLYDEDKPDKPDKPDDEDDEDDEDQSKKSSKNFVNRLDF